MKTASATDEIRRGERFAFGANWARFLRTLTQDRIQEAETSLLRMLEVPDLRGRTFLDIGCGSGLFSLAARRLGARVHGFDFDPQSVACAGELKARFFPGDEAWTIAQASVLDRDFVASLGRFDVVYSWGVLHHTGSMWAAVEHAVGLVARGGRIWIALYNRQPLLSAFWARVKRGYLRIPSPLRPLYVVPFFLYGTGAGLAVDLLHGRDPRLRYAGCGRRGMNPWHDWVDWIGGWPFEVASPREVLSFAEQRGFTPVRVVTVGARHGCNEYVFRRATDGA